MLTLRQLAKVSAALALIALAVPSSAFAQSTRTWVSGVGDDANPCSRTAPCKTFAGAISKTADGGEINALDPGGFGAVTITKSITIKSEGFTAGVLVSGPNGIIINAAATDKVTLKGLDINGFGAGPPTSPAGVKIMSARTVHIIDTEIYKFKAGVAVVPTSTATNVVITDCHIHDNGVGVINAPGNNAIAFSTVTLRHNHIQDNTCGAAVGSFGANASPPNANVDCGTAPATSGINKMATISAFYNGFNDNGTAVFSRGGLGVFEIANNDITGNSAFGLRRFDGGTIKVFTPATNVISNNAQ